MDKFAGSENHDELYNIQFILSELFNKYDRINYSRDLVEFFLQLEVECFFVCLKDEVFTKKTLNRIKIFLFRNLINPLMPWVSSRPYYNSSSRKLNNKRRFFSLKINRKSRDFFLIKSWKNHYRKTMRKLISLLVKYLYYKGFFLFFTMSFCFFSH